MVQNHVYMDIQTRKIEFVQQFLKLQNEEIITQFEKLLKKRLSSDIDDQLKPMSIEELNLRIDKSEEDFNQNRYKSTAELLTKYR